MSINLFKKKDFFDFCFKHPCYFMSQFQRGVIFILFKKDNCFPSHINLFCQILLCEVKSGPVFLDSVIHF